MSDLKPNITPGAYCGTCKRTVDVSPLLDKADLPEALKSGKDVAVMHVTAEGDHIWNLDVEDRQHNAIGKRICLGQLLSSDLKNCRSGVVSV